MRKVHHRRYIKLEVDEENHLLVQTWLKPCTSKEFRRGQLHMLKYFEKYKCSTFISNTLKAGALNQSDSEWAATDVTPKIKSLGAETIHFVIPENSFAMLAIRNFEKKDKEITKINTCFHSTLSEAIDAALKG